MATEEPPPLLTLKERIAALQLAQAADNSVSKPPPPAPPRRQVSSPAASYNTPQQAYKGSDDHDPDSKNIVLAPSVRKSELVKRNPPSLPPRRPSQASVTAEPPALPPRRPSQLTASRKPSNDSISSVASGLTSNSAISTRTSFSAAYEDPTSTGSRFRIKAPEYNPAKLPALPERRSHRQPDESEDIIPLRSTVSAPHALPRPGQVAIESPPALPTRRQAPSVNSTNDDISTALVSSLPEFGFSHASKPPPIPSNRPQRPGASIVEYGQPSPDGSTVVVELDANTFDNIILRSGKPAFVDFYAPFCKYCKELDPVYEELAVSYYHKNITIAKIDSYGQKSIGERYQVEGWPTLKFFDGSGGEPVNFEWMRDLEWMSRFIDEQMAMLPANTICPPPIPIASRPVF
ncbi:hypothetical protein JX265_000743 [Neoarthrinium moseri]|uniref:Thioredoxin domain-containing protein n=1 Tax=Neoarthrinium moseri TaxID=1658444 RepID=A0A9P9WWD6_9PEZI|nr:hypothetical protein JX265_000743 [Neoarthrinium moseri]